MATAVVEVPSESVCNTAAATMLLEYIKSHNQPLTYKQWQCSMLVTVAFMHKALLQLQTCKRLETASNNQTVTAVAQHIEQRIE